ncbi:MAG TPA: ACT domain-containing protein, partial [Candidatus Limnocylindrales bacterium]
SLAARRRAPRDRRYHQQHGRARDRTTGQGGEMSDWFTVRLDDRPGSLARLATALGERGVNITGIVGVAEDTDGTLMLTTSDAEATNTVLATLGIDHERHTDATSSAAGLPEVRRGLADRGLDVERGA